MEKISEFSENQKKIRIAVLGAGVAGLCTLRHFADDPQYIVTAFEQQNRLGGIWNYPEGCEEQPDAPETSPFYCRVYRNLRTNSPRDLTQMRDFPLQDGPETYLERSVVLDYIHDYAKNFNLLPFIKFRHRITSVAPFHSEEISEETVCQWKITIQDLNTDTLTEDIYDVIFICNGHFNKPYLPDIPGMNRYRGPVIHSSAYRTPEPYRNKTVLIIGAGSSGNDIVCELMHVAKKLIVKHKVAARKFPDKFSTVQEVSEIRLTEEGVVLADGTPVVIDAVILCTGFQFHFPFLSENCNLEISRGRVAPLYRHMINCFFPTMIFIGLLSGTPFLGAGTEDQILFCKFFLEKKMKIFSKKETKNLTKNEMLAECEEEFQNRLEDGLPPHRAHMMRKRLWPYCRELAQDAGFPPHDPVMEKISIASNLNIVFTPYDFRNYRIKKLDSENFICERLNPSNE